MYVLLVATAVLLGGLPTARAQGGCLLGYCGNFCCPNSINFLDITCCRESRSCCTPGSSDATATMTCDNQICPWGLPQDQVYDGNDQIRDQCCKYFKSGCCSDSENQTLDLLYKLAIGLGIGLGLLLIIVSLLVCGCLFCKLCLD